MEDPERCRVQIIYTQIDRDENNTPSFTSYTYRLNENEYFYPASTVKLPAAALALGTAYLYTGDGRYAHKGALLLDRIADLYPAMDLTPYSEMGLQNSHGGTGRGRIKGCIWETGVAAALARAWDAVSAGIEGDEELARFLYGQAAQWGITADKSSIERIRRHVEDGLLREFIASCRDRRIQP